MADALERTLALIKPDAVAAGKAEEIMHLIEVKGFTIVAKNKLQLTRTRAEEFYGEHKGKPFFENLVNFMTSGPIWAMVLARVNAIKEWRAMMGPTNTFKAREEQPRCLRALYGTDGTRNACHGSDSPTSAAREIKFYFPPLILEPLATTTAAEQYISRHLQPSLTKALTALAREKPSADKFEAITFLANYLLNNNPNKPRIMTPEDVSHVAEAVLGLPGDDNDDEDAVFAKATLIDAPGTQPPSGSPTPPPPAAALPIKPPTPPAPLAAADASKPSTPATAVTSRPGSAARPPSARLVKPPSDTPTDPAQLPPAPVVDLTNTAAAVAAAPPHAAVLVGVDPDEAEVAATKVQAAFRGHRARKHVAARRAAIAEAEPSGQYEQGDEEGDREGEGEEGEDGEGAEEEGQEEGEEGEEGAPPEGEDA